MKPYGHSDVLCSVAQLKSSQNRDTRVAKDLFDNGIYIFQGAAILEGSENDPGHAVKTTAQVKLGKHAVNPVRRLSSVL
jgi:hypothetical protein